MECIDFSILMKVFNECDNSIKETVMLILGKLTAFVNFEKCLEDGKCIIKLCVGCLNLEELKSFYCICLNILHKLLKYPLLANEFSQTKGIDSLLSVVENCDDNLKILALKILTVLSWDFHLTKQIYEHFFKFLLGSICSSNAELQVVAIMCLTNLMSCQPNRRHLMRSGFLPKLVSLFEKPLLFEVLEPLLKIIACAFDSPMALNMSDITTIVLWISRFVFGDHKVGDEDKSSISKIPRMGSVIKTPKSKRRDNSAVARPDRADWPGIQGVSCRILERIAQSKKCLPLLMANGVDQKLMELISTKSTDIGVQGAAAKALSCLLRNEAVRACVTLAGGVNKFARLLEPDNMELRSAALVALGALVVDNPLACEEVSQFPHLLPQLLDSLKACESDVLNALVIVQELSRNGEIRDQLHTLGVIPATVDALSSRSTRIQAKSLSILPPLLSSHDGFTSFQQVGGMEKLLKCLQSTHLEVQKEAAATIGLLAHSKPVAGVLYEAGVFEELYKLRCLEGQCYPSLVDIAIKSILDANPTLKFAMTGFLDFSDDTGDIFYDVGSLKATDRLRSLKCYANDPVNESRPVWVLNITDLWTQDSSGFSLPYDPELRKVIQVCADKIKESTNLCEKAQILAIEIANFFGGPMIRAEASSSIDWQEVAQYRCHYNTNLVPISLPSRAGYRHRVLLFKFITDKMGIPCGCVCGKYQIAYNVICIQDNANGEKNFVVDLMASPGALYTTDSKAAFEYCDL